MTRGLFDAICALDYTNSSNSTFASFRSRAHAIDARSSAGMFGMRALFGDARMYRRSGRLAMADEVIPHFHNT
jgi:hypothetical protein